MANEYQILLTNDDGIDSPGLWAAAEALEPQGRVWVVAPREQSTSSGRSTPPSSEGGVSQKTVSFHGRVWSGFAVGGTPAQAVLHALLGIMPQRPDLVVSGINYGVNVGSGVTNSGTIGAALEAASRGVPALAVSLETEMHHELGHSLEIDFCTSATFTALFAGRMLAVPLPEDVYAIKVDIPNTANPQTPWQVTRLAMDPYYLPHIVEPVHPGGPQRIWYTVQADPSVYQPGTDANTVFVQRQVAVTPLSLDLTSRVTLSDLKHLLANPRGDSNE